MQRLLKPGMDIDEFKLNITDAQLLALRNENHQLMVDIEEIEKEFIHIKANYDYYVKQHSRGIATADDVREARKAFEDTQNRLSMHKCFLSAVSFAIQKKLDAEEVIKNKLHEEEAPLFEKVVIVENQTAYENLKAKIAAYGASPEHNKKFASSAHQLADEFKNSEPKHDEILNAAGTLLEKDKNTVENQKIFADLISKYDDKPRRRSYRFGIFMSFLSAAIILGGIGATVILGPVAIPIIALGVVTLIASKVMITNNKPKPTITCMEKFHSTAKSGLFVRYNDGTVKQKVQAFGVTKPKHLRTAS